MPLQRLYWADLAGVLILILALIGFLFRPGRQSTDLLDWREWFNLLIIMCPLAGFSLLRKHAYRQRVPWIMMLYCVSALAIIALTFWPWELLLFLVVTGFCSLILLVMMIMRSRTLAEPILRTDVFKLAALLAAAIITLILGEVVTRASIGLLSQDLQRQVSAVPGGAGVAHPYIGHLHTPNARTVATGSDFRGVHNTDGLGFRNAWPWPSTADIVVVGDSVAFGWGVDDSQAWPALLARALSGVRLVNLSLIGGGPQHYLRIYETYGTKLKPRLLLVGLFPTNDFGDAEWFDRWWSSGVGGNDLSFRDYGQPEPVNFSLSDPLGSMDRLFRLKAYPLIRSSYLYNLLRAWVARDRRVNVAEAKYFQFSDGSRVGLSPRSYARQIAMSKPGRAEFDLLTSTLRSLHSMALQHGTQVLIVLQPGKEEIYLRLLDGPVDDPNAALRESLEASGIEYLDAAPVFRQRAAAGAKLFNEADGHPNVAGYALLADLVASYLANKPWRDAP